MVMFTDMSDALSEATAIVEGQCGGIMRKFLEENVVGKKSKEKLLMADKILAGDVQRVLGIQCDVSSIATETQRLIRSEFSHLIPGLDDANMTQMNLGLSHSLSRYKIKFSPDKVDTMIVQAVALLDDLDKELNTYAMRAREWYGWHFPELAKILNDNETFCRVVKVMGDRTRAHSTDFEGVLEPEMAEELKEAAQISMGTEISVEDLDNITMLCDQVIALGQFRKQLSDYLRARMNAIAPNLTVLVGELVGARLIAHAGSLVSLSKQPGSTIQILGAEKALFRAIKTRHETPKYGLIFHASLIGQASQKFKGKIARMLAAKCALAIRVDALGDVDTPAIGETHRAKVEERIRVLEGYAGTTDAKSAGQAKAKQQKKYDPRVDAADPTKQRRDAQVVSGAADVTVTAERGKRDRSGSDGQGIVVPQPPAEEGLVDDRKLKKSKKKEKKDKKKDKKKKDKKKKDKK